jgi:hypothetical protein
LQAIPFSGQRYIMDQIEPVELSLHNIGIVPASAIQIIIAWSIVTAEAESAPDGVVSSTTNQHIVYKVPEQYIVTRIALPTNRIGDRQIRTPQDEILDILRERILDLAQHPVSTFPVVLHHGIAWILNPVVIVPRPTDHPVGAA